MQELRPQLLKLPQPASKMDAQREAVVFEIVVAGVNEVGQGRWGNDDGKCGLYDNKLMQGRGIMMQDRGCVECYVACRIVSRLVRKNVDCFSETEVACIIRTRAIYVVEVVSKGRPR